MKRKYLSFMHRLLGMVAFPMVSPFLFIGCDPIGPVVSSTIWENCTLEEFEAEAAAMQPTMHTNCWVRLHVLEDKWPSNCFERIATVLKGNPNKLFFLEMEYKRIVDTHGTEITTLEENVFAGCENLTYLDFPQDIKTIKSEAFKNCKNMTHQYLFHVKSIGDKAYAGCTKMDIEIPNTVTTMGKNVFEGWTSSQRIYVPFAENGKPDGWSDKWDAGCNAVIKYKGEW